MNEKKYQVFAHYDRDPDHEFHLVLSPDTTVNWKDRAAEIRPGIDALLREEHP